MKPIFNEHLNSRPYPGAPHVKFHIIDATRPNHSLCSRVFCPHSYSIFSPAFVFRFDSVNQCPDCVQVYHELRQSAECASGR